MSKAIRVHEYGGADRLRLDELPVPEPGPGQVLIRQEAIGVNFIDVYFRTGLYKLPSLPSVIGMEGAGIVEAVGEDAHGIAVGDRIAYPTHLGAYAKYRVLPAERAIVLPEGLDARVAAAAMLKGLTVQALVRQVHALKKGDAALVYAAAGGVGMLLCQWAAHLGATVIGVVSTEEKAALARANGAAHVLVGRGDIAAKVRRITGGAMVPVVYDSVGRDSFTDSLDCLAPRGLMVSYGNASGEVTGVSLSQLAARGSLYVTRPKLTTFIDRRDQLESASAELFALLRDGTLSVRIGQEFPLAAAAEAHRALEERGTTGSTLLIPD